MSSKNWAVNHQKSCKAGVEAQKVLMVEISCCTSGLLHSDAFVVVCVFFFQFLILSCIATCCFTVLHLLHESMFCLALSPTDIFHLHCFSLSYFSDISSRFDKLQQLLLLYAAKTSGTTWEIGLLAQDKILRSWRNKFDRNLKKILIFFFS